MENLSSLLSRAVFALAFFVVGVAILERVAFVFGYTILRGAFTGGRLLEIAGILMIFVIAILLRQIRDQLRSQS
jgi:hypothetical protein